MKVYSLTVSEMSVGLIFYKINVLQTSVLKSWVTDIGGCIQKFPDWPPGARTANGPALCHYVQLYSYFVSQSREF